MTSSTAFTDLWSKPIQDAAYQAVSGSNRDLERYAKGRIIGYQELALAVTVRGIDWSAATFPKEIISKIFMTGNKFTKNGRPRDDGMSNQFLANILVKNGEIEMTESGTHNYWLLQLEKNWLRETSKIARTGL